MNEDRLAKRRDRDRDRYHNNPEARAKQLARQRAWRAKRRAEDHVFLASDRKKRADYERRRYHTDPEFRANTLARVCEASWLNRAWLR